jgi:hypothetical protein
VTPSRILAGTSTCFVTVHGPLEGSARADVKKSTDNAIAPNSIAPARSHSDLWHIIISSQLVYAFEAFIALTPAQALTDDKILAGLRTGDPNEHSREVCPAKTVGGLFDQKMAH